MDDARAQAIAHIEEARSVHRSWFDWQEYNEDWEGADLGLGEAAGGPEWHHAWIEKYDLVLSVLRSCY